MSTELERLAFLRDIEENVADSSGSGHPTASTKASQGGRFRRRAGALAALALAGGAAFLTQTGAAQAETPVRAQPEAAAAPCINPQPIPESQTFYCGSSQWVFDYLRTEGNCYVFHEYAYLVGCGAQHDYGERTICA